MKKLLEKKGERIAFKSSQTRELIMQLINNRICNLPLLSSSPHHKKQLGLLLLSFRAGSDWRKWMINKKKPISKINPRVSFLCALLLDILIYSTFFPTKHFLSFSPFPFINVGDDFFLFSTSDAYENSDLGFLSLTQKLN